MPVDRDAQIDAMLDLVERGESLDALAAQEGVSTGLVRDHALATRGQTWWAEHVVRGRPVDQEDVDRGLALITWGLTPYEAADRAGVAVPTLRRHGRNLHGADWWDKTARGRELDDAEVTRAVEMLEGGASVSETITALDAVGLSLRRAIIERLGDDWWDEHATIEAPDDRAVERALDMLSKGVLVSDAAAEIGTTPEILRARAEALYGRVWWIRRVARRVSPETLQEGIDAIQAGRSLAEAAELVGVSQTTLRRQCIELMGAEWWTRHVVMRSQLPAGVLDEDTLATVLETHRDAGPTAAAEVLGVQRSELYDILRRVLDDETYRELVPDRRVSPEIVEELVARFEAGTPVVEAAQELGVLVGTAYRCVRTALGDLQYRRLVGRVGWASAGVDVDHLVEQLDSGASPAAIAEEVELSAHTVRVLLASRLGVARYRELANDPSHVLPADVPSDLSTWLASAHGGGVEPR